MLKNTIKLLFNLDSIYFSFDNQLVGRSQVVWCIHHYTMKS